MTLDERKALQSVILDEITQQMQAQPTLLIDALLSDQGRAFVHQVLSRRLGMATQLTQMLQHLGRAFQTRTAVEQALTQQEEVA